MTADQHNSNGAASQSDSDSAELRYRLREKVEALYTSLRDELDAEHGAPTNQEEEQTFEDPDAGHLYRWARDFVDAHHEDFAELSER
ncbi:MAG: hypothetical protein ABEL76_07000 [Bradymonadaceae bacterium]